MFVELHLIQNFAPSCLNRDDTNTPKDCEFGGYRRARVSSQCLKRSIRTSEQFKKALAGHLSDRSLRFPQLVVNALQSKKLDEKALKAIGSQLEKIAKKESKGDGSEAPKSERDDREFKTPQIMFFTSEEVQECAERIEALLKSGTKPKDIVDTKNRRLKDGEPLPIPRTVDIALFGRMITSNAFMDIDAACQVAHAISTHCVDMEMDFYTAVDDLNPKEETGAGMMGIVEFNSSCFYRYAVLDACQLAENLGGDADLARKAAQAFVEAAIYAIPTGKQNSMAAHNPPVYARLVARDGAPRSLANAFIAPIRRSDERDLALASIEALEKHAADLDRMYGTGGVKCDVAASTYEGHGDKTVQDLVAAAGEVMG